MTILKSLGESAFSDKLLDHNYGFGDKYLSGVFTILMMLAFLIDQAQQLSCWLFRAVAEKTWIKRELWETIRSLFKQFKVDSMETILRSKIGRKCLVKTVCWRYLGQNGICLMLVLAKGRS